MDYIAIQSLGHDTALGRALGARRGVLGAQAGARAWALGRERACGRERWCGRTRAAGAGGAQARGTCRQQGGWGAGRHRRAGRGRARGLGVPVRMVGMLAGSAGPVWVLVNLAQF